MQRESMEFDVVIIGAGPAGLSAAIRLKQQALANDHELSVCVLEKGAEVGAHILSGAVIETRALDELLPNWQELNAPITTAVTSDHFWLLTAKKSYTLPTPPPMHNQGNYIVSLANVCRWLAEQAENLGVDIYPGFSAVDFVLEDNIVKGVLTGDMGVNKDGSEGSQYQPGMYLIAKHTILAEGARGSLTKKAVQRFKLAKNASPKTYAIGLKELWQVDNDKHELGKVIHTIGWPMDTQTYGGSFMYHREDNKIALGFVIGLDYRNPYLSPFDELQRFKTHPAIKPFLENGERIAYGARALNEGGWQAIGDCYFPGGMVIGCAAGFLNVPKIKGTHLAMKSGMLAADAIIENITQEKFNSRTYQAKIENSWIKTELTAVRNIRPAFQQGLWVGLAYAALDTYILRGKAPWTFKHHYDHKQLHKTDTLQTITYPKADNTLTFDKLTSLSFSNVHHEENQPPHLKLTVPSIATAVNLAEYAGPETRYCPAGVYEFVNNELGEKQLQINAQNCIHCKTCDIKDPTQNINWTPPEGGGGPNYPDM